MKIEIKGKAIYEWPQLGNTVQVSKSGKCGTVIRKTKVGQFVVRLEPDYKFGVFYEDELELPQQLRVVHDMIRVLEIEREIGREVSRRELDQGSFTARALSGLEHTYSIPCLQFPYDLFSKASDLTIATGNRWASYESKFEGKPPHRDLELEQFYEEHRVLLSKNAHASLYDSELEIENESSTKSEDRFMKARKRKKSTA